MAGQAERAGDKRAESVTVPVVHETMSLVDSQMVLFYAGHRTIWKLKEGETFHRGSRLICGER